MGAMVVDELERFLKGNSLQGEVCEEMMGGIA
jgi:hypothetical protein